MVPERNSICFENWLDHTTEKAISVSVFSLCKSISETTSDALVGFLNFWLQCPSATWHVYVYLGCIGNDQGPPPLRRGEHLAENHHPRSLRLRAPPLESEGPRNSPTSSHASTPRPCKLLQDTGRQDASRRNVLTYTRTQSLERTSWRRGSSTRPSTARKLDQAPHGTSEAQNI